jgi:hypothetical protein
MPRTLGPESCQAEIMEDQSRAPPSQDGTNTTVKLWAKGPHSVWRHGQPIRAIKPPGSYDRSLYPSLQSGMSAADSLPEPVIDEICRKNAMSRSALGQYQLTQIEVTSAAPITLPPSRRTILMPDRSELTYDVVQPKTPYHQVRVTLAHGNRR